MTTVTRQKAASGKQRATVSRSARARIEVRRIDDTVRLEVSSDDPEAAALLQQFVGALNGRGRQFDAAATHNPAFDRPIRLESAGFDDDGDVDSIALEADVTRTVLSVGSAHEQRAAAFCQRHRHTTTTEAMDDLAAEFERVAREARAAALRAVGEWCVDQASAAKEGTGKDG